MCRNEVSFLIQKSEDLNNAMAKAWNLVIFSVLFLWNGSSSKQAVACSYVGMHCGWTISTRQRSRSRGPEVGSREEIFFLTPELEKLKS
jgi:hypothetical protein